MRNVIRCLLACGSLFAISAGAANLIPNPDFDQGLTDWNTITPGNGTAVLDESTGYPTAPSVHLVSDPAAADVNVSSACVSVDDSSTQDLYVNARINAGFAIATVGFFSDAACAEAETSVSSDPIAANGGAWSTFSFLGIAPPNGTQSAEIILTATMGTGTVGGDVGFDHIEFGPSGTVPDLVDIDQEGLSGSWYNPATSGQGLQLQIAPQPPGSPGAGDLFGAWYTYDVSAGSADTQRWYTIQSSLMGAGAADVTIFQNTGGNFDAPPVTSAVAVGNGTLQFDSCVTGTFDYTFDDGRTGSIPLRRLLPNVECVDSGTPTNPTSDFGFSGAWYDAATSGQGIVAEINPSDAQAFVGWYTYAMDGATDGASGQRWFTAQAPYAVGARSINLIVYSSTGGTFDSSSTPVATDPVGTATLTFTSCSDATFDYAFTSGELSGQAGSITLTRLLSPPTSCSFSNTH